MKEKPRKKIVIVGGGISGLSSGIYAQLNGFQSLIVEKNPTPGGLCTSWERKGYKIDGCIHWLTGTRNKNEINDMWRDVEAFNPQDIIHFDDFGTINVNGRDIVLYADLVKLEAELLEIAPEDEKYIRKFIKLTIAIVNTPLPLHLPTDLMNILHLIKVGIKFVPYLVDMLFCMKTPAYSFADRFKSEDLKILFRSIIPDKKGNLYQVVYSFGTIAAHNGGVPVGGSSALIKSMASRYEELGGEIKTSCPVEEILIEKNKAVGVKTKNNEIIKGDYVISSTDAFETIKHLLKDDYYVPAFKKRESKFSNFPTPSCVLVNFSVDENKINSLKKTATYEFQTDKYEVGGSEFTSVKFRNYSYDRTFIKEGRTILHVLISQDNENFPYWENLHKNYKNYLLKKKEIATLIKEKIENNFPSLKGDLEILDICTPMTFKKWTNAYCGAYMPFSYTAKGNVLMHNGKIPGLKNFYLSGQWTMSPGGLPLALASGKFSIQRILKQEKMFFNFSRVLNFKIK